MDCSLPGSSVHGILQARILEWVVIPFSKGSSWLRDWTQVSYIVGRFFTAEPPGKPNIKFNQRSEKMHKQTKKAVKQDKALMVRKQSYL